MMEPKWTDFNALITILLEDTGTCFTVHKYVACDRSSFVRACLQDGFREKEEQTIIIKEWTTDQSMQYLVAWMYQGSEALKASTVSTTVDPERSVVFATQLQLAKLYILADRFLMPKLKNDVIDLFCSRPGRFSVTAMRVLWTEGPAECHLKNYILHRIVGDFRLRIMRNEEALDGEEQMKIPSKLVELIGDSSDFAQALIQMLIVGIPRDRTVCLYHEHGDDDVCAVKVKHEDLAAESYITTSDVTATASS